VDTVQFLVTFAKMGLALSAAASGMLFAPKRKGCGVMSIAQ
jgi:hypothetical protein